MLCLWLHAARTQLWLGEGWEEEGHMAEVWPLE